MSEKRNKRISVLVTEGEYGEIHRKALQANLSAGSYIRTVALSGEQVVFVDKSGIIAGHLGNNIITARIFGNHGNGDCDPAVEHHNRNSRCHAALFLGGNAYE